MTRNITGAAFIFCSFLFWVLGCSQSGRRVPGVPTTVVQPEKQAEPIINRTDKTVVKMTKVNGVYKIPVSVDNVTMFFIFDTGASTISISETEAVFLFKQGLLSKDDIKGSQNYTDATGGISEGTVIVLKTVQIGDKTLHDIEASVIHNMNAPLLIGQSALEKFGRISIDYDKGEITFE